MTIREAVKKHCELSDDDLENKLKNDGAASLKKGGRLQKGGS